MPYDVGIDPPAPDGGHEVPRGPTRATPATRATSATRVTRVRSVPIDPLAGAAAVLFDLDDTLIDYSAARDAAVVAWAEGYEVPLAGDPLVALWADLERIHFARYVSGELTVQEQRRARVRGLPGLSPLSDDAADAAFTGFLALSEQQWRALPGAAEAVRRIARDRVVGVVTNGAPDIQVRKLAVLGLADLPMFASVATGFAKPHPEAFLGACRALGVRADHTTVMVGDNLEADVLGALGAGLRAVWVDPAGRECPADALTVRSVAELI